MDINTIFASLTDQEIKEVLTELFEAENTGLYTESSKFRILVEKVIEVTHQPYSTMMFLTEKVVTTEAAKRWYNQKNV